MKVRGGAVKKFGAKRRMRFAGGKVAKPSAFGKKGLTKGKRKFAPKKSKGVLSRGKSKGKAKKGTRKGMEKDKIHMCYNFKLSFLQHFGQGTSSGLKAVRV